MGTGPVGPGGGFGPWISLADRILTYATGARLPTFQANEVNRAVVALARAAVDRDSAQVAAAMAKLRSIQPVAGKFALELQQALDLST